MTQSETLQDRYAKLVKISEMLELRSIEESKVPNPKQIRFLISQAQHKLLCGLNQGGKSWSLQLWIRYHMTGLYPEWWIAGGGRVFEKPIFALLGGDTTERTRDIMCDDLLYGDMGELGGGVIPGDCLKKEKIETRTGSVKGLVDRFWVKHHDPFTRKPNGWSRAKVFAYSQASIMGYSPDIIAIDEEPPQLVFEELQNRLNATDGDMAIAMTPLNGYTELYNTFSNSRHPDLYELITYGVHDAQHMPKEKRDKLVRKYKGTHMERARLYGEPTVGEGAIFPFDESCYLVRPQGVPKSWPGLIGIDLPHTSGAFAAVLVRVDPEDGTVWLTHEYQDSQKSTDEYVRNVKAIGGHILPCAWPHDGNRRTEDGRTIAETLKDAGLNMQLRPAFQWVQGEKKMEKSKSTNLVIQKLFDLITHGQFRVFDTCERFRKQMRTYRHKDGRPAKDQDDHEIDALFKALMRIEDAQRPDHRPTREPDSEVLNHGSYDFYTAAAG